MDRSRERVSRDYHAGLVNRARAMAGVPSVLARETESARLADVYGALFDRLGAHIDYECLTLLHTGNPGLQVMTRDDRWIDVPVDPDTLVVKIGDMMEAWTNGILRSTPHRVLNLSPERFSLPFFTATNHDTVIAPFPELVEDSTAPRYAPFTAGAHLERMLVRDFPYLQDRAPTPGLITNPFEDRLVPNDD